jgi:hypothetical protein
LEKAILICGLFVKLLARIKQSPANAVCCKRSRLDCKVRTVLDLAGQDIKNYKPNLRIGLIIFENN